MGGKCSLMDRSAVYRQSTGSILNSGAVSFKYFLPPCLYVTVSKRRPVQCFQRFPCWDFHTLSSALLVAQCLCTYPCFRCSVHVSYSTFHRESASYHEIKQAATTYQAAKRCLLGPNAPFAGWVASGDEWESFDARGELRSEAQTRQHNYSEHTVVGDPHATSV